MATRQSTEPQGRLRLNSSYNFTTKADVIYEIRDLIALHDVTLKYVSNKSGVCVATMKKWFNGKTKRPQKPTMNAVLKVFRKRLGVVDL